MLLGRALHIGTDAVTRLAENVFTACSEDSEEPSSESFSAAVVFVNLAFSWILLNFEAMMGSTGVMIITPDTTHSAPDILPPVKNTERKCHDFGRN